MIHKYIFTLFAFVFIIYSCHTAKTKTSLAKPQFNKTELKGVIFTQRFYCYSKKNVLEEIAEGAPANSDNFGLYYSSSKNPAWIRLNVIKNQANVGINFKDLVFIFPNDKMKYTINMNDVTKELIVKDENGSTQVFKKE